MTPKPCRRAAAQMRDFDKLPKPLRQAIAGAARVYSVQDIKARIAKGRDPYRIALGIRRYEERT